MLEADPRRWTGLRILILTLLLAAGALFCAAQPETGRAAAEPGVRGAALPATSAAAPQEAAATLVPPEVEAASAIVVDMDDGRVIHAKDADLERPMASTTKIMTALLALETLPLDQEVTLSVKAASVGRQWLALEAGDRLTVQQLLYAALLRSANNAAIALAEAAAGSTEAFVVRMNEKAEELGLTHTHYVNPHGLDAPGQYSSASDLAVLARVAMQDEAFRRIVRTMGYSILVPGSATPLVFTNRNELLGSVGWVTGVKTGSTPAAGSCLVASGSREGHPVISVVLGEPSWEATWADSVALMEFGFAWARSASEPTAWARIFERLRAMVEAVGRLYPAAAALPGTVGA